MKVDLKNVNRILIIGGPGTGKTTLAQKLSSILKIPAIHLDGINYKSNWEKVENDIRDKIILEKIKADKWIIDGNYANTLKQRIEKADLIILLDYSTFSIIKGVVTRYITNFNKEKKEIPGCKERIDKEFFKYVISFRKNGRKKIVEQIDNKTKEKVIVFYNRKQLNNWLELY